MEEKKKRYALKSKIELSWKSVSPRWWSLENKGGHRPHKPIFQLWAWALMVQAIPPASLIVPQDEIRG